MEDNRYGYEFTTKNGSERTSKKDRRNRYRTYFETI